MLLSGQTTAPVVRYGVEGTATSGAAGVGEGGTKPESTLAISTVDEQVKKVATVCSISDELLQDAQGVQMFINSSLGRFINIEVERQLLRGTAGGVEVQGLLTGRGVPVYAGGTAAGNKAEQLFKAANGVRGSAFTESEWLVINPADYEQIRLLKDNNSQLYGGGPVFGPYGGPQRPADASGQVTGGTDRIWGLETHVTNALGAGTALIGNRAAAAVMNRTGLLVEASNSHDSYFVTDLVAIRAERRLALCVYRPSSFVEVRLA